MSARIIDGKQVACDIRAELKSEVAALKEKSGVTPGLAVILVGDDPASKSYVTAKEKACAEIGIYSDDNRLPADYPESELFALIEKLNDDPKIDGILVQLPLPKHIDEDKVLTAIRPEKDVDGFHPMNVGRMLIGEPCFLPCTPHGIIQLLLRSGVKTDGAHAVVIGRSNIVGKPVANMLARKAEGGNATVTLCHTRTPNLADFTRQADILVVASGHPKTVTGDMVKPGATVIDVGVNRVPDATAAKGYRLVGDVDFESAKEVAGLITPVPGGVGPMTITMLLYNTVQSAKCRAPWSGHVHASTLLELKDGGFLAAWFQGSKESAPDVCIVGSRRIGGVWEKPRVLADIPDVPQWNPVLRRGDDGRIVLYFKVSSTIQDWNTYIVESHDEGATWDSPRELVPGDESGGRGPVKNKCLKLSDGTWLAPASVERGAWEAFIDVSTDDGRTWTRRPFFVKPDVNTGDKLGDGVLCVIQPSLWQSGPSDVSCLMRSNNKALYRSDSHDGGKTWSPLYDSGVPNNNSGIDLVRRRDGRLVLICNPIARNWGGRNQLDAWVSEDDGKTWKADLTLAFDPEPKQPDGRGTEFSYPAIIEMNDGRLAVTHTWNRRQIKFLILD